MTLSGVMVLNGKRFTLLENGIGIMLWIKFRRYQYLKMVSFVKFLLIQQVFDISFLSICLKGLSVGYISGLIDLDFLLGSAQICKKCTIFGNLRTITQEKKARQMTSFFHILFEFQMFVILYLYLKNVKIRYHVVPSLVHSGL